MGFSDIKRRILACLREGRFEHEAREALAEKNLLAIGALSVDETIRIISRCRGTQYIAKPMSESPEILKHEMKPDIDGERWFIRFYFLPDDGGMFISVHKSHYRR